MNERWTEVPLGGSLTSAPGFLKTLKDGGGEKWNSLRPQFILMCTSALCLVDLNSLSEMLYIPWCFALALFGLYWAYQLFGLPSWRIQCHTVQSTAGEIEGKHHWMEYLGLNPLYSPQSYERFWHILKINENPVGQREITPGIASISAISLSSEP